MTLLNSDIIELNNSAIEWGSCYDYTENENNRSQTCNITLKSNCLGLFVGSTGCFSNYIDSQFKNDTGKWQSSGISSSYFNSIPIGVNIWGSIFIGIYSPSGITLSDGLNTFSSSDSTQYALLINPTVRSIRFADYIKSELSPNTSIFSGEYNRNYGNRFDPEINNREIPIEFENIFLDWTIPSIVELKFLYKNYIKSFSLRNKLTSMFMNKNMIATSSSVFLADRSKYPNVKNINKKYLYGMRINTGNIEFVSPSILSNCLLVRSIPLL